MREKLFPEVVPLDGLCFPAENFESLEDALQFAEALKKSINERKVVIYTQVDGADGERYYVRGVLKRDEGRMGDFEYINRTGLYMVAWR